MGMNFNFSLGRFGISYGQPGISAAAQDTEGTAGVSRASSAGWLTSLFGGGKSKAGVRVNEDTAMAISAHYRCLRILSGTVGMLPLKLYRRTSNGREEAKDHPLYKLVKNGPNPGMTSFNWRSTSQGNLSAAGNAFSIVDRDGRGNIQQMRLVPASKVTVKRSQTDGSLFYDTPDERNIPARRMLHLRGFSWDGEIGLSTLELARETMGLALVTEEAGAEVFSKGAIPPFFISVKGNPDKEQRKNYRDGWNELWQGHRYSPAVVGEMVKVEQLKLSLQDLQFLALRKYQVVEICRWHGVPPHKVYELDRATFTNIEHQGIEWLQDSVDPILVNWEQEMGKTLLTPTEQDEFYFEFGRDAVTRTDIKTRYEAYKIAREIGDLSVDEIRSFENRSSVEGGNTRIEPMNMRPLGSAAAEAKKGTTE